MTATQQVAKPTVKARPNLTSVTPSAPAAPPETEGMDTTTPMDTSVIAFTQRDFPKWGAWTLDRLQQFWPHLTGFNYMGILGQCMADRGTLFLRAKKALVMATVTREPMEPRPVCDIIFCFKHHPDDEQENKDVRLLFRRVEDWAKSQGVRYVRVLYPDRMDTTYSKTKDCLYADDVRVIVKDLDK